MIFVLLLFLVVSFSLAAPQGEDGVFTASTVVEETTTVSPTPKATTTKTGIPPKPTITEVVIPAQAEVDCSDSSWVPTVDAWVKEEVDKKLKEWWESIPDRDSKNFVAEFGKAFGDSAHNIACGVDTEDQCINPSCKVFRAANAPKWTYFVRVAISNLNRFMRLLHAGIGDGQLGFEALREEVAEDFFPWKDTRTDLEKAAPWLAAIFSTAAGFVPFGFAAKGVVGILSQGLITGVSTSGAAFAGAAFTQVSLDPAIRPIIERMRLLSELGAFVADYCSTARDILGKWSMVIFKGGKDRSGKDIFAYLRGGRFVLHDQWTKSDLEKFFKKRLVAWEHTKTFILCANSTSPDSVVSPLDSQYITGNGTRVCSLYRLDDEGNLKDLIAVEKLEQPQYGITARDMVQSSVEAYLANGLDYTAQDMTERLQISAALPSDKQWFAKGAAGEGAFTIPICDVGHETEWMGRGLPCCCGIGCKDTKSFMEEVNMGGFDPVEQKCREICPVCAAVDYGNDASRSKPSGRALVGMFIAIGAASFWLG
ncbi:unnamed protein product [Tuber aestivum]|uniref:Uncharacterized protein n=1 Tax=Tuber aestivum TaxID=59557 RepID=A0A292Q836_9PEZI|nr:unnamed protein product [Tuber aestivum]